MVLVIDNMGCWEIIGSVGVIRSNWGKSDRITYCGEILSSFLGLPQGFDLSTVFCINADELRGHLASSLASYADSSI